jgi:CheY-like chemotaxis protein
MNKKQHILIVDDNRTNLLLLKEVLSDDYQLTTFTTPRKALESYMAGTYDLIISDLMMPEMTGIELLEQVRNLNSAIPFIIITANTEDQNEKDAYQAGVNDFLYKPVNIGSLLNTVKRHINYGINKHQNENI